MPNIATPWHPHTKPYGENDPWIIHPDDAQIEEKDCEEVIPKGGKLKNDLRNDLLDKLNMPHLKIPSEKKSNSSNFNFYLSV